ncbi:sulfatase-like hydrolase/transferase [Pasteurella sp. PK-2025]|uniref:sulfatase-like hydrolase/transferase n=1 Tax=unclassified Pasteurella TaxID=2621516 RepID=UPI003C7125B2
MLKRFFSYLNYRLFYIWLLFFSFLSSIMYPENLLGYSVISAFIFYYLIYSISSSFFSFVIVFVTITLSIYFPVLLNYGSLNSGIIAAFLETNVRESLEFMENITVSDFLLSFLFLLSGVILLRLKKYNKRSPYNKKKKILYYVLSFAFVFSLLFSPTKYYFSGDEDENERRWTLANTPITIIAFYFKIYESISDYYLEKKELEMASKKTSPWKVISSSPKYKNYVLIIGESARRDYLSTYGFHLPTTPFLDSTKGYINSGYISAAPATYHSLLKTLYFKVNKKRDYSYNIINLAKSANFETYWISNQGSIGKYDTIASRVGASADFFYFTKKAGFNIGDEDDFVLLSELNKQLNKNHENEKPRLFVLHLMGSHQRFCDRVKENEKILTFINEELSCYVNSILKTDKFIASVIDELKSKNESYSLIYFSDHGLSHENKDQIKEMSLNYNADFKSNYEVPFFKLSSDDTQRIIVDTKRSAFNFIYGFSQWLGIHTEELKGDYHFFSEIDDRKIKVFNFERNVDFDNLKNDAIPVIQGEE